ASQHLVEVFSGRQVLHHDAVRVSPHRSDLPNHLHAVLMVGDDLRPFEVPGDPLPSVRTQVVGRVPVAVLARGVRADPTPLVQTPRHGPPPLSPRTRTRCPAAAPARTAPTRSAGRSSPPRARTPAPAPPRPRPARARTRSGT